MENEIWKDVVGYEGAYKVSSLGKVMSLKNDIILKPVVCAAGYKQVNLFRGGRSRSIMIHLIVASAFLKKTDKYVNHKDLDKLNNSVGNLEYTSNRGNSYHYHISNGGTPGIEKIGEKYQVRIRINGIKKYFGRFNDFIEALKVRDQAILAADKEKYKALLKEAGVK